MAHPAATHHTVSTPHTDVLFRALARYRATVLTPSKNLQGTLIGACCVAAGFVFRAGTIRYLAWAVAVLVLAWYASTTWRSRISDARNDPYHASCQPEVVELNEEELVRHLPDGSPVAIPYSQVLDAHVDDNYVFLLLHRGEIMALSTAHENQLAGDGTRLAHDLSRLIGRPVLQLDGRARARLRSTRERRASYVEEHPGLTERIMSSARDRRSKDNDAHS